MLILSVDITWTIVKPMDISMCNFISIFRERIFLVYVVTNKTIFYAKPKFRETNVKTHRLRYDM